MRQEGRHIDFYAHEAAKRLENHAAARGATRMALQQFWAPVGAGVMSPAEVRFLARYLFSDEAGEVALARIDRQIDRLPGLAGLHLASRSVRSRRAH